MDIKRAADKPTAWADPAYFTGAVQFDPIVSAPEPARLSAAKVSFAPGARTAWHTHPLGQTLYVLSGVGRVQREGEAIQEIFAGDTVWIPPGERHWHGASPTHGMVHIGMQESLNGVAVEWEALVTDEEYAA